MGQHLSSISNILLCQRRPDLKFILFGLDAAGKTSLLYRLKTGSLVSTIPTAGFNVETVTSPDGRAGLTVWDTGGRCRMRSIYRHYYPYTHGLVFVIDSGDPDRLEAAFDEFAHYVADEDELRCLPIAVLCNKCELPGAADTVTVVQTRLAQMADAAAGAGLLYNSHPYRCFAVSVATGAGLAESLNWLVQSALSPGQWQKQQLLAQRRDEATEAAGGWSNWLYGTIKSALMS